MSAHARNAGLTNSNHTDTQLIGPTLYITDLTPFLHSKLPQKEYKNCKVLYSKDDYSYITGKIRKQPVASTNSYKYSKNQPTSLNSSNVSHKCSFYQRKILRQLLMPKKLLPLLPLLPLAPWKSYILAA